MRQATSLWWLIIDFIIGRPILVYHKTPTAGDTLTVNGMVAEFKKK